LVVIERELSDEFAGQLSELTIETLAEEEVAALEHAHVRDFVSVLAGRKARIRAKRIVAAAFDLHSAARPTTAPL